MNPPGQSELLLTFDPVALDYYASKHVIYPLGGSYKDRHDPDSFSGLIDHLAGARDFINDNGGIGGEQVHTGDENIEVLLASEIVSNLGEGGASGGGGCFISTATD